MHGLSVGGVIISRSHAHDSCEIWDFKGMGTVMHVHCDIIW